MIEAHLLQRFPGDSLRRTAVREKLTNACINFVGSGLADEKFASELVSGNDGKFWARASEALIAERLQGKTFPARTVAGVGPDLLVLDGNRRIWIEIVCPEPAGLPDEWLSAPTGVAVSFPHEQILLRWTSAIKEKAEKLIGSIDGKIKGYLATGIVKPDDAYVIAVNGCQLRSGPFPALMGISQFPFAAEAVFPIGPYQLHISPETLKVANKGHQHRPYVINKNGAQVPAYTFLDPRFNPISAIWAVDFDGASAIGNPEPMLVVHNPNAINPVAPGFLPADSEYIAKSIGDDFLLERHRTAAVENQ